VGEHLAGRPDASLGGVVLSGVVDRLALHELLSLVARCRRSLGLGAPIVVVSEPPRAVERWEPAATELVSGRPLHEATWELLLERAGFVEVAPLHAGPGVADGRFALSATTPS